MFSDRTLINRRNVTGDTHSSYRANRDFFSILFTSRIIAAVMSVLGFANKSGAPAKHTLPENLQSLKKAEKLDCLHEMSAKVVDEFVFQHSAIVNDLVNHVVSEEERDEILNRQELTPEGRFPCRYPGCERSFWIIPIEAVRNVGAIFDSTLSLVPQVNSLCKTASYHLRNIAHIRHLLSKESTEILVHAFVFSKLDYCNALLYGFPQCVIKKLQLFIWNRSVNNIGKKGTNIPLDEATEHSNNFIKQGIRNLGPNVTEKAVSRLSYSEMHTVKILGNLDETIKRMLRSGKHSEGSTNRDLHELVNRAVELNIFTESQGRNYNHFKNFQCDRLGNLNASSLYQWINKHKKNITWGIRA